MRRRATLLLAALMMALALTFSGAAMADTDGNSPISSDPTCNPNTLGPIMSFWWCPANP
jgi:hypothetical protein